MKIRITVGSILFLITVFTVIKLTLKEKKDMLENSTVRILERLKKMMLLKKERNHSSEIFQQLPKMLKICLKTPLM